MKSRLRASFLTSVPRETKSLNSLRNDLVSPARLYYKKAVGTFRLERSEGQKQFLGSFPEEEDEFAELGLPVVKSSTAVPRLMTEKIESIKRRCGASRSSILSEIGYLGKSAAKLNNSSKPLNAEPEIANVPKSDHGLESEHLGTHLSIEDSSLVVKQNDALSGIGRILKKPFQERILESTCSNVEPENLKNPGSDECREMPKIISSSSVTVHNVPSVINLSQLKVAISVFGKVSNAILREVPNGLDCCDIEFESAESRDRAVSAGRINVENFSLPIRPVGVPEIAAVRVVNIGPEPAVSAIDVPSSSHASLEGLLREIEDSVDVNYGVKLKSESKRILQNVPDEEDEFAELGSPVINFAAPDSKLMTEKNESTKRCIATQNSLPSDIRNWMKSVAKLNNFSKPLSLEAKGAKISKSEHGLESEVLVENLSSATVEDWPLVIRQNDMHVESVQILKKAFQNLAEDYSTFHNNKHESLKNPESNLKCRKAYKIKTSIRKLCGKEDAVPVLQKISNAIVRTVPNELDCQEQI